MAFLGIRCSNHDYSFAILSGTKESPKVDQKDTIAFPKGYSKPNSLKWFLQELQELFEKNPSIRVIGIKGAEPMASRGKAFIERIENETIVYLSAANSGIKAIFRKPKVTIAKDLGLKGKAKYLADLECNFFPDFKKESEKIQEAVLVAWSCIR